MNYWLLPFISNIIKFCRRKENGRGITDEVLKVNKMFRQVQVFILRCLCVKIESQN